MNDARRIHVVYLTERGAEVVAAQPDLFYLQMLVGGDIEDVAVAGDLHLVCNERGALEPLPVHWIINGEPIHGRCFLTHVGFVPSDDGFDEPDYIGYADDVAAVACASAINAAIHGRPGPWTITWEPVDLQGS